MNRPATPFLPFRSPLRVTVAAILAVCAVARADEVHTAGPKYHGVRITGFENGLVKLTERGEVLVPVEEITYISVDGGGRFDDLNEAEQMAISGKLAQAVPRYQRSLRVLNGFWKELVLARLVQRTDAAGQLDRAVTYLMRLGAGSDSGIATAARVLPANLPTRRTGASSRALATLSGAITNRREGSFRTVLIALRYLLSESVGDAQAGPRALELSRLRLDQRIGSPAMYAAKLEALDRLLRDAAAGDALLGANMIIGSCDASLLPAALLRKGHAQVALADRPADYVRASWPFLRVCVHFPQSSEAVPAWRGAADALRRAGETDDARRALRACLDRSDVSQAVRTAINNELESLE